jgi:energy-coupling factor transporter ATP-binding protein EcfA2
MKIMKIKLQAFKAFAQTEEIDLSGKEGEGKQAKTVGKHLLLFGTNGSGKSSLYNALYYALRGAYASPEEIATTLSNDYAENVRNHYASADLPTQVRLTFDNGEQYTLGEDVTNVPTVAQKIRQAFESSEMMSYKLLYAFYYFRQEENANLYPIFKNEFFPFWQNSQKQTYSAWSESLYASARSLKEQNTKKSEASYKTLQASLLTFTQELTATLENMAQPANEWYQRLTDAQDAELRISFVVSSPFVLTGYELSEPVISLQLQTPHKKTVRTISRPHTYLNESRLTMFALAIRLASFELRLANNTLKVLVLDDLLLSLDMSNRMKVFEIFLFSPKFKDFQKFIFTHDKGLYDVLKKNIVLHASAGKDWKFIEMFENPDKTLNPIQKDDKNNLSKAVEYYEAKDFEASALYLRKRVEELLRVYYDAELLSLSRLKILETLGNAIQESNLKKEVQYKLMESLEKVLTSGNLETDIITRLFDNNPPQDASALGKFNKLKNELKTWLETYTKQKAQQEKETQDLLKTAKLLDEIRARMLNAGAHYTDTPLFDWEVRGAIEKVKDFEKVVLGIQSKEDK